MGTDIILTLALFTLILVSIIWPKIFKKKKQVEQHTYDNSIKSQRISPKKIAEEKLKEPIHN